MNGRLLIVIHMVVILLSKTFPWALFKGPNFYSSGTVFLFFFSLFSQIMWLSNSFAINTIPFNEIEVKTIFVFQPQGELLYFIHFCIGFGDKKPESTYIKISTGSIKIILLIEWLAQVFMLNIFDEWTKFMAVP